MRARTHTVVRGDDLVVVCSDCKREFSIPPESQVYYLDRGWKMPKHCENCRSARRALAAKLSRD